MLVTIFSYNKPPQCQRYKYSLVLYFAIGFVNKKFKLEFVELTANKAEAKAGLIFDSVGDNRLPPASIAPA